MLRRRFTAVPTAFLTLLFIIPVCSARADAPDASRIDALESQLREIRRLYEARIAAPEKEVADLKTARVGAPALPAAAVPAPTPAGATPETPAAQAAANPPPTPPTGDTRAP